MKRLYVFALLMLTSMAFSQTEKSQVEFVATTTKIEAIDSRSGLLSMQLTPTYSLLVRATSITEIRDENDFPLSFSDLKAGMKLKIEGLFTEEGILAREVSVTQDQHEVEVKGVLEAVDIEGRTVTIAGLVVSLDSSLEIRNEDGLWLNLSDLEAGQMLKVEGTIRDGSFRAAEIKVSTFGLGRSRLDFDGAVNSIRGSQVLVKIEGVGDALVRIHPETVIHGSLSVGAGVRVSGSIGSDLAVDANQVLVKKRLQLNPDELHLDVSDVGRVHVFLAAAVELDTVLLVDSLNSAIAFPTSDSLVIPAGKVAGYFDVASGPGEGKTQIEVSLPESLGGGSASIEVEVETDSHHGGSDDSSGGVDDSGNNSGGSGDDSGKAEDELLEIRFSPDQITGVSNQALNSQLVLNQSAPADLTVTFTLDEGIGQPVTFAPQLTIPAGANFVDVEITTGLLTADVKIRAKLPAAAGGDTASLKIRVKN